MTTGSLKEVVPSVSGKEETGFIHGDGRDSLSGDIRDDASPRSRTASSDSSCREGVVAPGSSTVACTVDSFPGWSGVARGVV
jgi:hypothetical protein